MARTDARGGVGVVAYHPVEYAAAALEAWTPANSTAITTSDRITIVDAGPLVAPSRSSILSVTDRVGTTAERRSPRLDIHIADVDWNERDTCCRWCSHSLPPDTASCDVHSAGSATHPTLRRRGTRRSSRCALSLCHAPNRLVVAIPPQLR